MSLTLSAEQTLRLRMRAQRLSLRTQSLSLRTQSSGQPAGPAPAAAASIVWAVCGLQAQDLPSAWLSLRARDRGLTLSSVADSAPDSIVWTWAMRGTLHLLTGEDARWLVPLLGPALSAGDERRMRQLGWDEDSTARGLRLLMQALDRQGELTRAEVIRLLAENGLPAEGQAPVHLLFRAAAEGRILKRLGAGREDTVVPFTAILRELSPRPREEAAANVRANARMLALTDLARRYLAAYAPAGMQDFAAWSGLKMADVRLGWQGIADQLAPVVLPGGLPAWLLKDQLGWLEDPAAPEPQVSLLPRYDTYWMGYASRELAIDPAFARQVLPGGGQISAALLVDGRARGTWRTQVRKDRLEVEVTPFAPLGEALLPALEAEAADIGRFLGRAAVLLLK